MFLFNRMGGREVFCRPEHSPAEEMLQSKQVNLTVSVYQFGPFAFLDVKLLARMPISGKELVE